MIFKERGDAIKGMAEADKKRREGFYKKAGEHFQELMVKYAATDLAKQAKALVAALQTQVVVVVTETSDQERIAAEIQNEASSPRLEPEVPWFNLNGVR